MDTGQLMAFDRIVREGSFSRAAQYMDISQPTISTRIQVLEAEVGGPLFIRGGRQMALTQLGESFLPYARRALSVLAEGAEAARLAQEGQRGRVKIGTIESLTGGFFADAVSRFTRTHPAVELFIRTGHTDQVVQMLDDGVVKLGLITWPFFGADLAPCLRFREPLILVAPPNHPLAGRKQATLEEVARVEEPLLHVRWGPTARPLMARLEDVSRVKMEVPIDTARQLVLAGTGAAFLTRTLVENDLHAGRLVEIEVTDLSPVYRDSALVALKRATIGPAAEDFIRMLGKGAGEIAVAR